MSANDAPSGVAKDDEYAQTGGMNRNQPIPVKKDDEQMYVHNLPMLHTDR